jgi:DNA-binding PadR family transcriptional regulator
MKEAVKREIEYFRIGHLTHYILKIIEGMPKVDMHPYYALILQELENKNRLGAGKSLLHSRLKFLSKNGFLKSEFGLSLNPKAKKKVRFYSISEKGKLLLSQLETEQKRISDSLLVYS